MPKWKAQTPIEVFEDNDVSVDARSGAERLGNKHRYHVGDSSRRKSIDKAGFRDDTAIDSSGSKRAQGKTFPAFGGSVPVPSPLGLASAPGSPEKFFPGGAKEFGAALMRQSSADERDLARDLLGPPPPPSSPFAARREPSANHRPGNLSPPRSPTRARAFSHVDDDVPSRPSSPAFGSSGAGAGAARRTPTPCAPGARATPGGWASAARRAGAAAPPRSVPANAPSALQRSQSMGSFADDVGVLSRIEISGGGSRRAARGGERIRRRRREETAAKNQARAAAAAIDRLRIARRRRRRRGAAGRLGCLRRRPQRGGEEVMRSFLTAGGERREGRKREATPRKKTRHDSFVPSL